MPRATPKRSGRKAKPGSRFLGEIVAENVRTWRGVRRLSQAQLAARMSGLGHPWTESIVGFVERGQRNVTVDEYIGLEVALEIDHFGGLLDPFGVNGETAYWRHVPEMDDAPGLDFGGPVPLPARLANRWLRGRVGQRVTFSAHGSPVQLLNWEASIELHEEGSATDTLSVQKSPEP